MRKSTQEELLCIIFGDDDFQLPNSSYRFTVDDVKDGESFWYNGIEFVRLGEEQGSVLCITKKIWKDLPFCTCVDDLPVRYYGSVIDRSLKEDFLKNINQEDILPMCINTAKTSCDLRKRGSDTMFFASVGLLSLAQYEKYKNKNVMPVFDRWIWTCSPYYDYSNFFCCVYSDGSASYSSANISRGCAPVILFKKEEKAIFDTNILFDA